MLSCRAFLAWLAEFTCAVAIIVFNKFLMRNLRFKFPITLTALHFVFTGIITHALASRENLPRATSKSTNVTFCGTDKKCLTREDGTQTEEQRPPKVGVSCMSKNDADETSQYSSLTTPPVFAYVLFAGISSVAIVLSNASLCVNSVAFYQIMKLPTLFFVAALEICTRAQTYDGIDLVCFLIIILGVAVTIEGELSTSATGFMIASASIVSTGLHQFYCSRMQSWYSLTPSELLAKVSPFKALALIAVGPVLDSYLFKSDITTVNLSSQLLTIVSITCLLAVALNILQYWVIRLLGSGFYQALSQLKTVAIVLLGSALFDRRANKLQILGVTQAVLGVYLVLMRRQRRC